MGGEGEEGRRGGREGGGELLVGVDGGRRRDSSAFALLICVCVVSVYVRVSVEGWLFERVAGMGGGWGGRDDGV